jgi:hypothetical protein
MVENSQKKPFLDDLISTKVLIEQSELIQK